MTNNFERAIITMSTTDLPRYFTKIIRDGAKNNYRKDTECYICGATEDLQFHHHNTISVLVNNWVNKHKLDVASLEEAQELRVVFISEHMDELYIHATTLCKTHHDKLHKVYGRNPILSTAPKQARWIEKQRVKHGLV